MKQQYFTILDAVSRNRQHPETFYVPDCDEISALSPGDYVKVGFDCTPLFMAQNPAALASAERMWLLVTNVDASGDVTIIRGTLANDPVLFDRLMRFGDEFSIEGCNVMDIMKVHRIHGDRHTV